MEKQLFNVPAIAMGLVEEKIAKLTKRAKKAGTSEIKLVRIGRKTEDDGSQTIVCAIEGDVVKYEGYTFLARLDHNVDASGASNIVYSMPGETLTEGQRLAGADCGHCGFRRNRKDTFILRDEAGEFLQVGRTCLKDFFGHNPEDILRRAQYITKVIDVIREGEACGEAYITNRRSIDLLTFLSYVVSSIDENGWTSGKDAFNDPDRMSSRDQAANTMFMWPRTLVEDLPTADHIAKADLVLEFITTLDPNKSDFNFNMTQMAKLQTIDFKATGIAAAMVFCYNRSLEQEAKKKLTKPQQDLSNSNYVGKEKERLQLDVTILSSREQEGQFGRYNITRMLDGAGNLFVSFGQYYAQPGDKATVKGTVKRHQDYNGVKQTVLNRVMAQ